MARQNDLDEMVVKELTIIFLLDRSGSMEGRPIAQLNDGMRSAVEELVTFESSNNDVTIRVAVISFGSDATWETVGEDGKPIAQYLEHANWHDLEASGRTALGAALKELRKHLSRKDLLNSETGCWAPIVILMSDGRPNDGDWQTALEDMKKNAWYNEAVKIAFALGDNADVKALGEIVGSTNAVIRTNDLDTFRKLLKKVPVATALTTTVNHAAKKLEGEDVIEEIAGNLAGNGKDGETVIPKGGLRDDDLDIFLHTIPGNDPNSPINFADQKKFMI